MIKNVLEVDSVQKQYDGKIIISDVYLKCETRFRKKWFGEIDTFKNHFRNRSC